mgnify:CR=1 FL=1
MEEENILDVINKLVEANVSINELRELAPLLETTDIEETYRVVENIGLAIKPFGRNELKNELRLASKEYHKEVKVIKLQNLKQWTLPAIAACLFVVVSISTITSIQNYSNKDKFNSHSGGAFYKKDLSPAIK